MKSKGSIIILAAIVLVVITTAMILFVIPKYPEVNKKIRELDENIISANVVYKANKAVVRIYLKNKPPADDVKFICRSSFGIVYGNRPKSYDNENDAQRALGYPMTIKTKIYYNYDIFTADYSSSVCIN